MISLVHDRPATPSEAQFSMPFAVGCILAFGKLGPDQITGETLAGKALQDAMAKVVMVEADDLNGPDYQPHYPECARVIISMLGGEIFTDFLGAPTGMPENPLSDDALSEKFRACTAFAGWPDEIGIGANRLADEIEVLGASRGAGAIEGGIGDGNIPEAVFVWAPSSAMPRPATGLPQPIISPAITEKDGIKEPVPVPSSFFFQAKDPRTRRSPG